MRYALSMALLRTTSLGKSYGNIVALDNLNFIVESGQVMGLLGSNGSGKSTTLGILLGVTKGYRGEYRWFNQDNHHKLRQRVGAILEEPIFYPYLSGANNLKIAAKIKRVAKQDIGRVLELVGLADRASSAFKTYSLGMKQRLAFASALLGKPEVLVLDEPTNGLDPQGIADIRDLIIRLAEDGITIILASHLLDEVEKVCTHVSVLKKGKLLSSGAVNEVIQGNDELHLKCKEPNKLLSAVSNMPELQNPTLKGETVIVTVDADYNEEALNKQLMEQDLILIGLQRIPKRLEDQFLELTK